MYYQQPPPVYMGPQYSGCLKALPECVKYFETTLHRN